MLEDLTKAGVRWRVLSIRNFGAPLPKTQEHWQEASILAHDILAREGRVLAHCRGGCGRSGMAILRLMVEAGEAPEPALKRLRCANPKAVETGDQRIWATTAFYQQN